MEGHRPPSKSGPSPLSQHADPAVLVEREPAGLIGTTPRQDLGGGSQPCPCSPPGPPLLGNHQQDDDGGADGDQPGPDGPEAMRGNVLDDPLRVDARGGHG